MFRYKVDLYAVDEKGNTIMEPRRAMCFAFTRSKAIDKCKRAISNAKKVRSTYLRVLNVEKSIF
ncbi:MAG: hypothetical protein GX066_07120 [Clostridiaceae bacterium]|nr:hypothetical protein [Clostridiaceae bacterium]